MRGAFGPRAREAREGPIKVAWFVPPGPNLTRINSPYRTGPPRDRSREGKVQLSTWCDPKSRHGGTRGQPDPVFPPSTHQGRIMAKTRLLVRIVRTVRSGLAFCMTLICKGHLGIRYRSFRVRTRSPLRGRSVRPRRPLAHQCIFLSLRGLAMSTARAPHLVGRVYQSAMPCGVAFEYSTALGVG